MVFESWDFELPPEAIARHPVEPRDSCKLLATGPDAAPLTHHRFSELGQLLVPGDLLVLNDTRVLPVRLAGRLPSGGRVEIFLLDPRPGLSKRRCLARPGKKIRDRTPVRFPGDMVAHVSREGEAFWAEFPLTSEEWGPWLDEAGAMPLPPYLNRPAEERDKEDYQTVFAREKGSVAAPTAGLHFTDSLLENLKKDGVRVGALTLHVGYGTFAPLPEDWTNHRLHAETFEIPARLWEQIQTTKEGGGRVIAVGTTVTRALESADPEKSRGATDLFIRPGHRFRWVDGLITNFHLPQTSLLLLVAALLGESKTREAYEAALAEGYRFYSYGDAMAVLPTRG